ncbi:MAG: UPF0104 family protein [Candidatus Electrothrix sp. AU1_5]|nr:UPF0104 family protein [Candidatus Electrothrix gigas]
MKSKFIKIGYFLLSLFIISWLLHSFKEGKELLKTANEVGYIYFLPQFILIFLSSLINSYLNMSLIQYVGLKLHWHEWIPLGFVNSLANLIFPAKSGTMVKAFYLKKKYSFEISKNFTLLLFTTFIAYLTIFFLTGTLLSFIKTLNNTNEIIINKFSTNSPIPLLDLFIIFMFSVPAIGISLFKLLISKIYDKSLNPKNTKTKIPFFAISLLQGFIQLGSNKNIAIKIFICTFLNYFIILGMLYWGFLAVNIHLNISQLIIINLFFSLQSFVNLLPGNIGIQELIITVSSGLIGGSFSDGLIVAAIIRLASLIEIFLLGSISYKILNINKILNQETPSGNN